MASNCLYQALLPQGILDLALTYLQGSIMGRNIVGAVSDVVEHGDCAKQVVRHVHGQLHDRPTLQRRQAEPQAASGKPM